MRPRLALVKASGLTMSPPFGCPEAATRARSISPASRIGVTVSLTPNECARGSIDCTNFSAKGPASGLKINAMLPSSGAISLMSSNHLAPIANSKLVNPVMLPPGCAKLETKPCPIGSPTTTKMIGIVLVSFRTATSDNVRRADIHNGREHMLQSEAGYIGARPHPPDRRTLLQRTAGPYNWVKIGG